MSRVAAKKRRERARHRAEHGCGVCEIEPGRGIANDWETALREPWAERKARLAAERDAGRQTAEACE